MRTLNLITSYKNHIVIACIIGLWLVLFLVFIAPFDAADLSFVNRVKILPLYGLISLLGYMILVPAQNWYFNLYHKWTVFSEVLFLILFNALVLFGSYVYYKTTIVNGTYNFTEFTLDIYSPILLILLPILIISRWFLFKKEQKTETKKIIIRGDKKLDVLQINLSDLVSISSADNYVEVNYLKNKTLQKKLLRNTLKKIQDEIPDLFKVHRSHLINPIHFKEWKGSTVLGMTQMDIPISKNYKQAFMDWLDSSLKTNTSPQTSINTMDS